MKAWSAAKVGTLMLAVVAVGTLTGCAFGDRKIALRYQPLAPIGGGTGQKVAVVKFVDRRDKPEVGEVRNGYGMKTATVFAQKQDLGAWVANALSDELSQAGFTVQKFQDAAPPDISVAITGFVPEAYTKMHMQNRCTVRVNITVQKAGVVVLNKEYKGYATSLAWTASTGEFENVMQKALQELMKQAVPEIVSAIKG
jgi:hypothetical protein